MWHSVRIYLCSILSIWNSKWQLIIINLVVVVAWNIACYYGHSWIWLVAAALLSLSLMLLQNYTLVLIIMVKLASRRNLRANLYFGQFHINPSTIPCWSHVFFGNFLCGVDQSVRPSIKHFQFYFWYPLNVINFLFYCFALEVTGGQVENRTVAFGLDWNDQWPEVAMLPSMPDSVLLNAVVVEMLVFVRQYSKCCNRKWCYTALHPMR